MTALELEILRLRQSINRKNRKMEKLFRIHPKNEELIISTQQKIDHLAMVLESREFQLALEKHT